MRNRSSGRRTIIVPPATTAMAAIPPATMRNCPISARKFGKYTTIAAPRIGPTRDFRPPIVTASKNCTDSSKLKLFGAIYCSEYANKAPANPAKPALRTKASTLCL